MLFYKNKELAEMLAINLSKWKRWVREFLPPDPLGGLQSGYARQLNLKETFKVYLGGHLVSKLKFSLPEARSILSDISPWLRGHGFLTLQLNQLAGAADPYLQYLIFIYNKPENGFAYTIREIVEHEYTGHEAGGQEKFRQIFINHDNDLIISGMACAARVVSLTNLTLRFIGRIGPHDLRRASRS